MIHPPPVGHKQLTMTAGSARTSRVRPPTIFSVSVVVVAFQKYEPWAVPSYNAGGLAVIAVARSLASVSHTKRRDRLAASKRITRIVSEPGSAYGIHIWNERGALDSVLGAWWVGTPG